MKNLEVLAGWLLVLGGVVLGVEGLLDTNLLYDVFGAGMVEKVIEVAIGASAVWMAYSMVTKKRK